ncbi:MAG: ATP-binding protein [Thermodesulfobacteriota bacterium]
MGVRRHVLVALACVVFGTAVAAALLSRWLLVPTFARLERDDAARHLDETRRQIHGLVRQLDSLSRDWASRAETATFAILRPEAFLDQHLSSQASASQPLDIIGIFGPDGAPIGLGHWDPETGGLCTSSPAGVVGGVPALIRQGEPASVQQGLALGLQGPFLFVVRPIPHPIDRETVAGTLLVGRFLTAALAWELGQRTGWQVTLRPWERGWADREATFRQPQVEDGLLVLREILPDVAGSPALLLEGRLPRTIDRQGRRAIGFYLLMLSVAEAGVLLVALMLVERGVRRSQLLTAAGATIEAETTVQALRHEPVAAGGDSMVVGDLPAVRRQEELMRRTEKLLSLPTLTGGIAHDFNNILAVLLGNICLLEKLTAGDPRTADLLTGCRKACLRAKALARQLLTFAKGGPPRRSVLRLDDLIQEAAGFTLSGSSSAASCRFAPDLWPVEGDEGQLAQVFQNLVANAAQAMPDGGEIGIVASNRALTADNAQGLPAGDYVVVTVSDQGPGIDPAVLPRIFEPYFTTKEKGSGLGLAICQTVARDHRGALVVQSALGQGATFLVFLPAGRGLPLPVRPRPRLSESQGRAVVADQDSPVPRTARSLGSSPGGQPAAVCHGGTTIEYRTRNVQPSLQPSKFLVGHSAVRLSP